MARVVFAMNLSLDGYADHDRFAPDPTLFRHWIEVTRAGTCSLYGRKLYELMRYWDEDQPDWGTDERDFAEAWRALPKWVASRSLREVGPNARLIEGDLVTAVRDLKGRFEGQIDVGGPALAQALGEAGLIDEYRLYYHPVVLGAGRPLFDGPLPRLRLTGHDRIGDETIRLTYVPA
jgi:dihydrofolate reductase